MTGATTLIRFREDQSRDVGIGRWADLHARRVIRDTTVSDCYLYNLAEDAPGIWPAIDGVETEIRSKDRIDAIDEMIFTKTTAPRSCNAERAGRFIEEFGVFGRVDRHQTNVRWGSIVRAGDHSAIGARYVVLVRRHEDVSDASFKRFVDGQLASGLAAADGVVDLRYQVFKTNQLETKATSAVAGKRRVVAKYHASIVIGAKSEGALAVALAQTNKLAAEQRKYCRAIHAYRVEKTQISSFGGRLLISQASIALPKPRLDPVRRVLPPPPARAKSREGASRFQVAGLLAADGNSPEDVVADAEGKLLYGVSDGRILRMDPISGRKEQVGHTHGRPLGLEVLPDGNLIVCDAYRGLLYLNPCDGSIRVLVDQVDDVPLRFCSNATAAADGTIWFTQASTHFDFAHYEGAMLEHRGTGRLLRRDPDGRVTVVINALHFANGITLDEEEASVIFAETDGYRLSRYWIKGERQGRVETLVENLPGFPDNISRMTNGRFWVAMPSARNEALDRLGRSPSFVRRFLWRFPGLMNAKRVQTAWAMAFDNKGQVLADLQASVAEFHSATSAVESNGHLYMASLRSESILALDLSHLLLSSHVTQ